MKEKIFGLGQLSELHFVCWVDEDFFKEIQLDVGSMGKNVKDLFVLGNFTKDELKIYSNKELEAIGEFKLNLLEGTKFQLDGKAYVLLSMRENNGDFEYLIMPTTKYGAPKGKLTVDMATGFALNGEALDDFLVDYVNSY